VSRGEKRDRRSVSGLKFVEQALEGLNKFGLLFRTKNFKVNLRTFIIGRNGVDAL
jgi:hypothetical protein